MSLLGRKWLTDIHSGWKEISLLPGSDRLEFTGRKKRDMIEAVQ